jgi:hypothetical protein
MVFLAAGGHRVARGSRKGLLMTERERFCKEQEELSIM